MQPIKTSLTSMQTGGRMLAVCKPCCLVRTAVWGALLKSMVPLLGWTALWRTAGRPLFRLHGCNASRAEVRLSKGFSHHIYHRRLGLCRGLQEA